VKDAPPSKVLEISSGSLVIKCWSKVGTGVGREFSSVCGVAEAKTYPSSVVGIVDDRDLKSSALTIGSVVAEVFFDCAPA
jgi:hypothetical protein